MNNTTTTSNPLLRVEDEDLEQVLNARKTIKKVAQKYGLSPQPHATQITNRNGSNGHRTHKTRMSQRVRDRISASMKKRWAQRRKAQEATAA
jgi:hypothetical protein